MVRPRVKVLRLYPGAVEELAPEDVYSGLSLPVPDGPHTEPYVAINMVSTLDGKVSVGGKASPIGSPVDRRVMRNIRCAFDAVLVGAGSVRAEEMNLGVPPDLAEKRSRRGRREQPLGVILAGASNLPLHRKLFQNLQVEGVPIVVVAGHSTPKSTLRRASRLGARVLVSDGSDLPEPVQILHMLKENLAVRSLLVEGGPSVNSSFLSANIVDDLFLTLNPKIVTNAEEHLSISESFSHKAATLGLSLSSVHLCPEESEMYLRYSFKH